MYHATKELDFEIGLGMFAAKPLPRGQLVSATDVADYIFGFVLHNDWSARDIQRYEMVPLGVFNSKSFMTSISPWIVTLDALRGCQSDPPPSNKTSIHKMLLCDEQFHGLFDIKLSATIASM